MRYAVNQSLRGWRVLDLSTSRVAQIGALRLEDLTRDEAEIMLGMVEAVDRAIGAAADLAPAPAERMSRTQLSATDRARDAVAAGSGALADLARSVLGHEFRTVGAS